MQISASKCTESVWRPGFARPTGGAYSAPPDLAVFKSGGSDMGRRKRETTGGDRQLREGDRNAGREKGRKRVCGEWRSRNLAGPSTPAGAPKGTPGDAKCVTEILWGQK